METNYDNITTYLDNNGIYSGVHKINTKSAMEQITDSYWTTCPFSATGRKYVLHKETNLFYEFADVIGRFRKTEIKIGDVDYERLIIAYKDNKLNKLRFDKPLDERPKWAQVRHFTDVMVLWKESHYTLINHRSEMWFLPTRVVYIGVEVKSRFEDFSLRVDVKNLVSAVPNPRTPYCVPVYALSTFNKLGEVVNSVHTSRCAIRRDNTLLFEEGEWFNGGWENMARVDEFIALCEERMLPCYIQSTTSYEMKRKSSTRYDPIFTCVSINPFTAVRKTKDTTTFNHTKTDEMVDKKDAFKEELVAYVFHPDRLERLYGENAMDALDM
jgi:hypothetical protein